MKLWRIPNNANLFRSAIFPVAFRRNTIVPDKFIKLYQFDTHTIKGSLIWQRFAPTEQMIHDYGCRLAAGQNEKARLEGKFKQDKRKIYCGCYQFKARALRSLAKEPGLQEINSVEVLHRAENEEIAHTDLLIELKPNVDPATVQGIITAIADRIWAVTSGPMRHICANEAVDDHPSAWLVDAPLGVYQDDRSRLGKIAAQLQFNVFSWAIINGYDE